jgi:hypothetical protein
MPFSMAISNYQRVTPTVGVVDPVTNLKWWEYPTTIVGGYISNCCDFTTEYPTTIVEGNIQLFFLNLSPTRHLTNLSLDCLVVSHEDQQDHPGDMPTTRNCQARVLGQDAVLTKLDASWWFVWFILVITISNRWMLIKWWLNGY